MLNETTNFDDIVTLTRPGSADYEDKNGDTQTAGVDEPRFNYSEGVGEGLLLDASIDEKAALLTLPGFSASQGTWIIDAELTQAKPIPGSGFDKLMSGSGVAVFVYDNGVGKCWADGEVLFTIDPMTPGIADYLTQGGNAKFKSLEYDPVPWSDAKAAENATGVFEISWTPEKLFLNGESGAWYDPSDLGTLFKDAAGTDPVTADGDPVGLMLDLSPNANHASQSVTGSKPTYRTDGTRHWLEFNGTKFLSTPTLSENVFTVSSGLFAAGASSNNLDSIAGILEEIETGAARVSLTADTRTATGRILIHAPNANTVSADRVSQWDGSTQVIVGAASSGPSIAGYINGSEKGSAVPQASFTSPTTLTIGRQTVGPLALEGNVYGIIARSTESSGDDISKITQYLAAKSGVTL